MQELKLSEKAAFHRIWVARVAWKFPCVMVALSEGRLHMSATRLLAAHFTEENAEAGRCTFVSENGTRCLSRRRLEFDHVRPVARGGPSTVDNVRLLCRAHNQLMAERVLGRGFVENKVEHAREAAERRAARQRASA